MKQIISLAVAKFCNKCKTLKPIEAFQFRDKQRGYRQSHCASCKLEYQQGEKYRATAARYRARPETKESQTRRHYLREFGITLEEFEEMIAAQDNRCFLCGVEFDRSTYANLRAPVLDHSHKDEGLRKVLCQLCNKSLGFIEQSMDRGILDRMISYSQGEAQY